MGMVIAMKIACCQLDQCRVIFIVHENAKKHVKDHLAYVEYKKSKRVKWIVSPVKSVAVGICPPPCSIHIHYGKQIQWKRSVG